MLKERQYLTNAQVEFNKDLLSKMKVDTTRKTDALTKERKQTQKELNHVFASIPSDETIAYLNSIEYLEDDDFTRIIKLNIHKAITVSYLNSIFSKGNINALELLHNYNHTISLEDLESECINILMNMRFSVWYDENGEKHIEDNHCLKIEGDKLIFNDSERILIVFKGLSNYLYDFKTKVSKHTFVELDNELIDVDNIKALSENVSIDMLLSDIEISGFLHTLKAQNKTDLLHLIYLRVEGLSFRECAFEMNLSIRQIRTLMDKIRDMWKEYIK